MCIERETGDTEGTDKPMTNPQCHGEIRKSSNSLTTVYKTQQTKLKPE